VAATRERRDAEDTGRPDELGPSLTTPVEPKVHGRPHRGVDVLPTSSFETGRFGRMFRHLPVFVHEEAPLLALAAKMIEQRGGAENPMIPAGYTYFGQFVDHDITFDPVSSLQRQNDPDGLHNFRTPRFDLDSVYGRGPADQPYLYEDGVKLRLGERVGGPPEADGPDVPRSLPRVNAGGDDDGGGPRQNLRGVALIGDPRNDENLIVSQLHVTMLRFHNAVVEHVKATQPALERENLFKEAQRITRWHYQWVVVHDFVRRVCGPDVVEDILRQETFVAGGETLTVIRPRLLFYTPANDAYMPVEFSVAAYRFGHSMIRGVYHINDVVKAARGGQPIPVFSDVTPEQDELQNLNGFRRLPIAWAFDWRFFFELPDDGDRLQHSLLIDPHLAGPLGNLPPEVADTIRSLAARNLLRGLHLSLPSGTSVARAMGIEPLNDTELDLEDPLLRLHPPLWYYILREAEVKTGGQTLGPVGGRIVAEVLIGLLANDPLSFLNVQSDWTPELAGEEGFGMPELIRFALAERQPGNVV
jgi:hypothetical protein